MSTVVLVGMGGVGKTQTAIELCYRQFAAATGAAAAPEGLSQPAHAHGHSASCQHVSYGLVLWLRAESEEALADDLRCLAMDNGVGVQGLANEDVVDEVSRWKRSPGHCARRHTHHAQLRLVLLIPGVGHAYSTGAQRMQYDTRCRPGGRYGRVSFVRARRGCSSLTT